MRRIIKKYPKSFLLVGVICCAAVACVWYGRYTVTSGEKYDSFSGVSYGYRVEQYYCWNTTRITIWNKRGLAYQMDSVYEFGQLTVEKVVGEKWLKNDLAIYLNLDIRYHDSLVSIHPIRIIYDFHRGEMHTSSGFSLWRIWNEKNKSEDWLKEDEFNKILDHLSVKPSFAN